MIKPKGLKKGDKVAIVSLSWGGLGDEDLIHRYYIAKARLENDFGLQVVAMPNALKGTKFVYEHPELRAKDLMDAFSDDSISAIFCAIGGDDSVRILPYIEYDVIKENPKIFMGYSDTTVNHFVMHKAGVVSYYGPSIMSEFGEYVKMFDYCENAVRNILFSNSEGLEITSSPIWSDDFIPWDEANVYKQLKTKKEEHGYEILQGSGVIEGSLLGGCLDVFPMIVGTRIWPGLDEWEGKILLIETSEDKPTSDYVTWYLRNLGAQGIFDVINGIIVGKPYHEEYYEEYKGVIKKVLKEFNREDLGVLYNVNIGHSDPVGLLPLGTKIRVDFDNKKITLVESAVDCNNKVLVK